MFDDIVIPSKIGDSYIFSKRIVSFEITQIAVDAVLLVCKGKDVVIQNKASVVLKDFSTATVVGAIKKIISTIGKYDEIVTSLSSASFVFKELQLPFIGYEKIEMIIGYEVEGLLPFALDQAVIDFMVIDEDHVKGISKILVAAALKQDVDAQLSLFEKAGVSLHLMAVDMFSLYTLYQHSMYAKQAVVHHKKASFLSKWQGFSLFGYHVGKKQKDVAIQQEQVIVALHNPIEMFVDVGFDAIKILYVSSGVLKSVRAVPYGVYDVLQSISKKLEVSYYDLVQQVIYKENPDQYQDVINEEFHKLFEQIVRTTAFFESQIKDGYKKPQKIIFSGLGSGLHHFIESAQNFFDMPVLQVVIPVLFKSLNIVDKKGFSVEQISNLATGLFGKYNNSCNLLKTFASKMDNRLFYKQFSVILLLTVGCIGGILWHSVSELQRWDRAYNASKKELAAILEKTMQLDVKKERNLKDIVTKAEEKLKYERKLWFSFSKQTEQSYLEFLQDLSVHIDREDIGLDLKRLSMDPDKVTLAGSLKEWEKLEVFKQELSELELLQLVEEPRELTFSIQLKVKDKDKEQA